jgi:hypothetical protein
MARRRSIGAESGIPMKYFSRFHISECVVFKRRGSRAMLTMDVSI